jgi:hypothetical protein
MSVAQVLNSSGGTPPPQGATPPEEVQQMSEATKALDGLEHIYMLGNSQTGEGQVIIVWRDDAARKAAADHIAADNVKLKDLLGVTLTFGPVYDNFAEI